MPKKTAFCPSTFAHNLAATFAAMQTCTKEHNSPVLGAYSTDDTILEFLESMGHCPYFPENQEFEIYHYVESLSGAHYTLFMSTLYSLFDKLDLVDRR